MIQSLSNLPNANSPRSMREEGRHKVAALLKAEDRYHPHGDLFKSVPTKKRGQLTAETCKVAGRCNSCCPRRFLREMRREMLYTRRGCQNSLLQH